MHLSSIDWPTAMVVLVYGVVCWIGGWHASLRASGTMYDEGYRNGHHDGRRVASAENGTGVTPNNGKAEKR